MLRNNGKCSHGYSVDKRGVDTKPGWVQEFCPKECPIGKGAPTGIPYKEGTTVE